MVETFGGQPCPATGFGMGYSTLSLMLADKGLLPEADIGCDYFIAPLSIDLGDEAAAIATELRKKYVVDIDLQGRKLQKQLKYADTIGAKKVIILGEDEVSKGVLKVRDLKTGKEVDTAIDNLMR
jgi:histidyl-tRNA synthetase